MTVPLLPSAPQELTEPPQELTQPPSAPSGPPSELSGPPSAARRAPSALWPASARTTPGGGLALGGVELTEIADRFGTPCYVLDEAELRAGARAWRQALPDAEVCYAAKAFLCRAVAAWVAEEGLGLDVCSAGELELAVTGGFPAERVLLHGNAKSPEDLRTALRLGVGRIVIDSLGEIAALAALVPATTRQKVLVRVVPGIEAGAHPAIRTGGEDQKFGLPIADGSAEKAVAAVLAQPRLELAGLHCHLGSQIAAPEPYEEAVRRIVPFLARLRHRYGVALPELDLGGGFAVAYREGDPAPGPEVFARRITAALARCCAEYDTPVPRLTVEPGRSIAGPAGTALYRVAAVKRGGRRTFVAVDGGMSDNPRPALYGARYTIRLIGRPATAPPRTVTVVGRHCEAGDVLAADAELPGDVRPGDLLAVPVAGAYHMSMASGYNLVGRPPVVAVADGHARVLVRRETLEDIRRRDVGL
ncbi:diaminopimelate decarboxylase [Streptomyces sp. URMC 123]|uniref:diaminopimelate decarboxylase n=1 Tax=Streptomyces sp. URMC 123 TaxID=3423403 RepID=UPI003F1BF6D5